MLDIKRIVDEREKVEEGLLKRMKAEDLDLDTIIKLNEEVKEARKTFEDKRAEQNSFNDKMAATEKGSDEFKELVAQLKETSNEVKELEEAVKTKEEELKKLIEVLPNVPDEDVVAGEKEANEITKTVGEKPSFEFKLKDHVELGTSLGILDFERASKIGGAQFPMYVGDGALLEWALINYFVKAHVRDGYEMILPPHILNKESGYAAGQFPKFEDDVYLTNTDQFLLPTSETALANYYRDETLTEEDLPRKFFSYTPCYRKEAGGYRSEERGLMRIHQFNKVEMFQYTKEEDSPAAHDELVAKAEELVAGLGLHYTVVKLAAEDCSAGMARTYDIEAYLPFADRYQEVSSISNARDYQSRRGNMRYKPAEGGKPQFMHTLNASGLATSRLMVALMETYQNEDGSITVPDVLRDDMGKDVIK